MGRMVPERIAFAAEAGINGGEVEGAVLCITVAGVAETVEAAIASEDVDPLQVDRIAESLYAALVSRLRSIGGLIVGIRGEIVTASFPAGSADDTREAVEAILAGPSEPEDAPVAKAGLCAGLLRWSVTGPPHHRCYAFHGTPVICARDAMERAAHGSLRPGEGSDERHGEDSDLPPADPDAPEETFFPEIRRRSAVQAYVGRIAVCLVGMEGPKELLEAAGTIVSLSEELDGFLSGMDMSQHGGSALVMFGAPLPLDNPERRAADFAVLLREAFPRRARLAVTAGRAFAGFVGSSERADYSILGNLAREAELRFSSAEPGQILVGPDVAEVIGAAYGLQPIVGAEKRKKRIRGKLYTLLWREDLPRTGKALFVGREEELETLRGYIAAGPWGSTRPSGDHGGGDSGDPGLLVLVSGPPGIGKTTLVRSSVAGWPAPSIFEVTGSDRPQAPFTCVSESLREYWDLPGGDDVRFSSYLSERFTTVARRTPDEASRSGLERSRPVIGYAMGESQLKVASLEPERRFQAIRLAWTTLLPLLPGVRIAVVDDYQWLDAASKLVLDRWIAGKRELKVLVTSRDEVEERPLFGRGLLSIPLQPLSLDLSRRILEIGGAAHRLEESEIERLVQRSGGNPFYLEQSAAYITAGAETSELPRQIEEIILRRIDQLSGSVRQAVTTASVLGSSFDMRVLSAMLREEALPEALRPAEVEGVWKAADQLNLIFSHALIRETVYRSRLETERRELHAAAARALQEVYGGSARRAHLYEIAEHYERAGMIGETRRYLSDAAEYALETFDNERAVELYRRRLRLAERSDLGARRDLARALQRVGSWDECIRVLGAAIDRYVAEPEECDGREAADCYHLLGNLLIERGESARGVEIVQRGISVAERNDYPSGLAYLYRALGYAAFSKEDYPAALDTYRRALAEAERSGEAEVRGRVVNNIALVYSATGRHDEALATFESNLAIARRENDYNGVSSALNNIGYLYNKMGRHEAALPYFQRDLRLSREAADQQGQSIAVGNVASILASLGRHEEAIPYIEEAIEIDGAIGFLPHKAYYHLQYGTSLRVLGREQEGCGELREALRIAREVDFPSIIEDAGEKLADCVDTE